jgi:hypothetical protein
VKKALISFGVLSHVELLEIAKPTLKAFAERHGYDFIIPANIEQRRPPAWYKIASVQAALAGGYDEVLFIDADCVIMDDSEDLNVPEGYWQAMVKHNINGVSEVPNTGMWLCRQPMLNILADVWAMTDYINHGWWEQGAVLHLMGYDVRNCSYCRLVVPTELYNKTYFLDAGWNRHVWDVTPAEHIRVQHATMYPDRAQIMRLWVKEAMAAGRIRGIIEQMY